MQILKRGGAKYAEDMQLLTKMAIMIWHSFIDILH
jgi:hypothetical protein